MNELELLLLAEEIKRTYEEEDQAPFPYEGCRVLLREFPGEYEMLIPDLNTYFMDIAGLCSWGKDTLKFPEDKLRKYHGILSFNFFQWQPQYANLQRLITEADTPDLYEMLKLYDQLRQKLLVLLSELIRLHEEKS